MEDVYRHAASILVLRPVDPSTTLRAGSGHQILLLHKPRKKDSWQLPQGGVEGNENVTEAALRELQEEAGLTGCTVIGTSEREYTYDFPPSFRRFRPDNVKGQLIKYVFALASKDAAVTVDGVEVDNSVWVGVDQLGQFIKRSEYLEIVKDLYNEALKILSAKS